MKQTAERVTITLQGEKQSETIENVGVFALVYVDDEGKRTIVNIKGSIDEAFLLQRGLVDALNAAIKAVDEKLFGGDDDE